MARAGIVKSGYGQQGYCKLCSFSDPKLQDDFDRRTGKLKPGKQVGDDKAYEYSPPMLNEWLEERGIKPVDRATVYRHRKHVMHPKDRLVNAVQKRERDHGTVPANVTEDTFLQSIVAVGAKKVAENPEEVTIDQALKAAQIRSNMQKKGTDINVLVNVMTSGDPQDVVIEGEATEV